MKLIFFLIVIFFSLNVPAYEFTADFKSGIYWPIFPIPMNFYVDNSNGQ